ncbi:GHKL domain-containing protein, partial [Clostridium saudiense]|nr:GHKL domain-containing protein [Clostridium saudiense]
AKRMASGDLNVKSSIYNNEEITQLSNTLNYMASEIEKREKLKNDFISSVSHELRTPLTAIKGWVITLNDDETDKETLKMGFDIIEKETDRLTLMVEELLDFSKLVSGIVHLNKRSINIISFVTHIENYMKPRALNEGIFFNVDISSTVSKGFFDYNKMKQVLINILDNAFKFTDKEGRVSLLVEQNENVIKFTIIDTGIGISPKELPRVKEKFYKGKNSNSKNGIGLSICDEIIKLHKGTFDIESELGKGTAVIITIPN